MSVKDTVVLSLFTVYLVLFILKPYFQFKRTGTNPFVLARGKKRPHDALERALMIFFIIAILSVILETWAGKFIPKFYHLSPLEWTGTGVIAAGVLLFIIAMFTMKNSWRIGIDTGKKTRLVKTGIYAYSRNPAFTGMAVIFIGFFLSYPDVLTLFLAFFEMIVIHLHILNEEKNLEKTMGKEYVGYKKKTPRYFLF